MEKVSRISSHSESVHEEIGAEDIHQCTLYKGRLYKERSKTTPLYSSRIRPSPTSIHKIGMTATEVMWAEDNIEQLYEERICLWDTCHPDYHDRTKQCLA